MLDVTRENFCEMLPCIGDSIEGSEFLSLDLEMTGINLPNNV